ncbi:MAG: hypothetical protein JW965_04195 [Bacteroidales bacterium]|nr:hypothetical protein [Bacteroidales bacterium]
MAGFSVNIILLIIIILLVILDILRNLQFIQSENITIAAILSYLTILAFFICYVFLPSDTFLLVAIITIGLIPNSYYWYQRVTKGERRTEALIISILFLAGIMYYLAKIF